MPTDQRDHEYVRKELTRYHNEIMPYITTMQPTQHWMSELISRLKQYGLTKTEVLNLINMGIGKRASADDQASPGENGQDVDMKMEDEEAQTQEDKDEAAMARDELFFRCAVEETDERFPDSSRIRDIIKVFQDSIRVAETGKIEVNGHNDEETV